eukprot:TRINITY_DN1535_c9_g1_i1.p1 TRINITY_DN1535_c9_g1~~TRINITY_DN1535_c9_g1_i1.p1  ORF type:complete len:746 (+),score=132.82 TRINITY_DN1535_c9_g1_i1:125-2362(+)
MQEMDAVDIVMGDGSDGSGDSLSKSLGAHENGVVNGPIEQKVPTPAPFLVKMNRSRLLDWWESWKEQFAEGTAGNRAITILAASFRLANTEKFSNLVAVTLASIAIIISIINFTLQSIILDISLSVITSIHIFTTIRLYYAWYERRVVYHCEYSKMYPTFATSPLLVTTIAHCGVILVHAPPIIAGWSDGKYRAINAIVLLRSLEILRTITHYTFVSSTGGTLVAALAGETIGPWFVYKMLLFKHPIVTMVVSALFGFVILSTATWFVEGTEDDWGIDNAMWFTIVTFTTVGYGDIVPKSWLGKLVGVVSAIFGIIASAVLVSIVQHKLALTRIQKQIIMFLCEVQASHRIKELSATIITRSIYYNYLLAKAGPNIPEHKSVLSYFTTDTKTRVLHTTYSRLISTVKVLQRVRSGEDGGTSWADISVLDVLQADTSDILAQNTVLQYMMRPADEDLSAQLRANKKTALGATRRVTQTRDSGGRPTSQESPTSRYAVPIPISPKAQSQVPSSVAISTSTTSSDKESVVSDMSYQSQVSNGSAVRTAASTKQLVDIVKSLVTASDPPPQSASRPPMSHAAARSFKMRSRMGVPLPEVLKSPPLSHDGDQSDRDDGYGGSLASLIDTDTCSETSNLPISPAAHPVPKRTRATGRERWRTAAMDVMKENKKRKGMINHLSEVGKSQNQIQLRLDRQDKKIDEMQKTLGLILGILKTQQKYSQPPSPNGLPLPPLPLTPPQVAEVSKPPS